MADGYFSRKVKKDFAEEIKASENFFYELKLGVGKCNFLELEDVAEYLFKTMELVHERRARFMKRNKGFIKRFFITYDSTIDMYEPHFKLVILSDKNKNEVELYKLHLQSYCQWLRIWCFLHKNFDDIVVKLEPLENENAEQIIQDFFKQPTIGANEMIDEQERKQILKNHNTVSLGGIFKEIKRNRHVSVEE